MKTMKHPLLLASAMLALATTCSNAATLLTYSAGTNTNTHTGTIGAVFTVGSSNLSVTSLGFHDIGNTGSLASNGDGLQGSHAVGIWNNTTGALVASATIQSGTSSALIVDYRYETLGSTVTLTAGQAYTIGAMMGSGDFYISANSANNFTVATGATGGVSVYDSDALMSTRPTLNGGLTNRWGPANMQFTVVPEPSAALLGGLGILALLRRRRA